MREVRIHDTLSGEPIRLEPRDPPRVGIYACGPTVYGPIHVGNARPFVVFMLLRRFLARVGYEPRLVINVTDVNDKIYDAAGERGVASAELAREMTRRYVGDTDRLGLGRPDAEPLATETIGPIVEEIEALVEAGHAYASDGDVYFSVRSFPEYGKLSNRRPEDMDQGEEAGVAHRKRDGLDFALWKGTKEGEDTSWPSPWGPGRPGWHIECSAMAEEELGLDFEVHGGGSDLVFPHHENEIAQSEAARGRRLARIWMHNGMLRLDESKMSKSEGNVFQLSAALDRFGPVDLIAYFLSGHYRKPLEFSVERVEQAAAGLERIRNLIRRGEGTGDAEEDALVGETRESFLSSLADDFNTPEAMAALYELVAEANRRSVPGAVAAIRDLLPVVGLDALLEERDEPDEGARALLERRQQARAERDFDAADRIRDELAALGWEVRDTPAGADLVRRP